MNKMDAELLQMMLDIRVAIGDLDNSRSNLIKIEHRLMERFQCASTNMNAENTLTAESSKTISIAEFPPANTGRKRDVC